MKSTDLKKTTTKPEVKEVQITPAEVTKEIAKEENVAVKIKEKDKEEKPFDMKEFLADETNINNARMLACQLKEVVSKNWFTLEKYIKNVKGTREEAITRLAALQHFGFCLNKIERNQPMFKINFDPRVEIEMVEQELSGLELRKKILSRKREELFEKVRKQDDKLDFSSSKPSSEKK